jgi:signal transduction histidine kinase
MDSKETQLGLLARLFLLLRLRQGAGMVQRFVAQYSWWRLPLVGYLLTVLLMGLNVLVALFERSLSGHPYFLSTGLLFITVLVAVIWGVGPALFSILLALLVLFYFVAPPVEALGLNIWDDLLILVPFCCAALTVAVLTSRLQAARRRARLAEQVARAHADELARANQELEAAHQLKDHFLSMASHELRTPLSFLNMQAQLMVRRMSQLPEGTSGQLDPADVRSAWEKVYQKTQQLDMLVDDLLDVSSIRAGKLELRLQPCDLAAICREVVGEQELLCGRLIELVVPATPVLLQADRDRLSQVVINLVSNALKYAPAKSVVQVAVSQQQASVILQVHNEGPAIPHEHQRRIFEFFYRVPDAHSSSKQGWGIGLAVCKEIVERHGGHIRVQSSEGKGTTFFVELP